MSRREKKKASGKPQASRWDRQAVRMVLQTAHEEFAQGDPLDVLQIVVENASDPGGDLAWLTAFDLDPTIAQTAQVLLLTAFRDDRVPEDARDTLARQAMPSLLKALQTPGVPDERKLALSGIYTLAGGDIGAIDLPSLLKDYEGSTRDALHKAASRISEHPQDVDALLRNLDVFTDDNTAPTADSLEAAGAMSSFMGEDNPDAAAVLLSTIIAVAIEHGIASDGVEKALNALAGLRRDRAAWCLNELAHWPATGTLGDRIRTLAGACDVPGAPTRPTVLGDFSRGTASAVDGSGSRGLTLAFRTPAGRTDACLLVLNDVAGLKDAWGMYEPGPDLEDALLMGGVASAPCTVALARELLADAWALHDDRSKPFPGRFFPLRAYFDAERIAPRRRTPDLSAYALDTLGRSPDLVKGSERLADEPLYGSLWFASDAAYDFVAALPPGRRRASRAIPLDEFAARIAYLGRDLLLERMAKNLELEALAGRAQQPLNRLAARTWLAIRENVVPIENVHYVCALCRTSLRAVSQNLRQGYRSQAEADRAELEAGSILRDLLDQVPDEFNAE